MATPPNTEPPKGGSGANSHQQSGKGGGDRGTKKDKSKGDGNNAKSSYVGHTEDISKYVINDSSNNKATQYKEMQERVITYASSNYSSQVGTSLRTFKTLTMLDFMPDPLDKNLYTNPKRNANGEIMTDETGSIIMEEDETTKETLKEMHSHMVKDNTRLYTDYKKHLTDMYRVVYGQVDDNFKSRLAGQQDFKTIEAVSDTIGLMRLIRDLCYKDSRTKVHRLTNLIRTTRKLLTSRQKGEDNSAFVREVNERFKVLKAIGGSILSNESLEAVLEDNGQTLQTYYEMTPIEQEVWNEKTEDAYIGALIVEGSNEDTSTLKQSLAQQFAMGTNAYPTTPSKAIDLMNEFKGTKESTKKSSSKKSNGGGNGNGKRNTAANGPPGGTKTGAANVTAGTIDRNVEGAQLLLAAMNTHERFNNDETIFFQFGEVTQTQHAPCFVHYGEIVHPPDSSSTPHHDSSNNGVFPSSDSVSGTEVTGDDSDDDWNYWADKDEDEYEYPDEIRDHDRNPDKMVTEPTEDTLPTSTDQPAVREIAVPDRSDRPSTHGDSTTTLTADSGNNTSETSGPRKRKAGTTCREAEQSNNARRPDPPGLSPGENPRSAPCVKPRSAHTEPIRAEKYSLPRYRNKGWSNICALDLAITEWQSKSFLTERSYRPSKKVEQMFAQHRGGIDPNWILLDSESSVNLIVNRSLLENIRVAPDGYNLTVHCNAGSAVTNKIGELPGFGTVWFYEDGIANVISLGLVTNSHRVTMDSSIDNAMYVHKDDGTIRRFSRGSNNLYYYDARESQSEATLLTITTVEGQKKQFSGLDRKRAERAYKLQEILWFPSDKDFLRMIDNKILNNCSITRRDIKIAREIYGRNRAAIQGKSVRRQVPHVREEISLVPESVLENYGNITLCCDIIHVNDVKFLVTISKHLGFRTARAITNARKRTLLESLKTVISQYTSRGFRVEQIFADNQFECVRDELLETYKGVTMNITAKDEHEPVIERSNRTVKDRVRCMYNSVPFKHFPIRMIAEMVYGAVFWLNSIPPEDGVSTHISPRELMTGYTLDANKHARYQFGEYIMAHVDETNNSMDPRAVDCIYLRPSGNSQGGFYAFDLSTGRRVHRMHGTALPMTDTVISRVKDIAKAQRAPEGLVFADSENKSTILDFEEDDIEEDDNASDASYSPKDDERSVETELSETTEASEISLVVDNDPMPQQVAEIDEQEPEVVVVGDPEPINEEEEPAQISDGEDNDTFGNDNHDDDTMDEHDNDNDAAVDAQADGGAAEDAQPETVDDEPEPMDVDDTEDGDADGAQQGRELRPTVRLGHNKYSEDEGYAPRVIHRGQCFTAGYAAAARKIEQDQWHAQLHTTSAVWQYNNIDASQVTKQYGVRQGLKIFGDEGVDAVLKELKQLHERSVVKPMRPSKMSKEMRAKALPYLMFLKRKRCGKVKGRGCADGRRQREFISKEEASSPTVSLYALMISCLIDAIEGRDVATADIPGAFLQTDMPDDEEVYMRLDGTMAELLCRLDPDLYGPCMIQQGKQQVLYVRAEKAIYGTLRAAILFWEKLSGKLTEWGYEANPYDACTMNKIIDGKQATIQWHVDDLKISHKDPRVVSFILDELNSEFGKISPLTSTRGKIHDYVGMTIDYTEQGKVKFSMFDYLEEIIQNLPEDFVGEAQTPAGHHLFTVNEDCTKLSTEQADLFHHYVAKLLFMAKRSRPDIATAISFMCTRVKEPDTDDWKKLGRVMKYLQLTPFLPLCLGWDGSGRVKWYVDASFAVHKDMRSHTGGLMTLGIGAVLSVSTKQKINTKSSTEAELVGVDDILNLEVWAQYFIESQYDGLDDSPFAKKTVLFQDNTSAMKLEKNGKSSSTKRTRHINIRYFFITDQVKAGRVGIEYCNTNDMIADFFTKPVQGAKFREHRNSIMGVTAEEYLDYKDSYFAAKSNNKRESEPKYGASNG